MTPSHLVTAVLTLAQAPGPTPEPALTIYTVTPGISGFLAFFALALASWVLFRSLTKHMRTVDRNARARAEGEADGDDGDGGSARPGAGPRAGAPPAP